MMVTVHPPASSALPFRPATAAAWRSSEPALREWLQQHKDGLFRWTLARGGDAAARRGFAEGAVAIQRLRGEGEFVDWLLAAAVLTARRSGTALQPGSALAGLPPELRALLRLVSHGDMRIEEALALLPQRMDYVRERLVRTRLGVRPAASSAGLMNA